MITPPNATAALRAPGQTRLSDSRPGGRTVDGTSSGAGPLSPGVVRRITVNGRAGVATTGAVVLNIQAVAPRSTGYLTAWPCAQPAPATSVLNVAAGGPSVANTTILALGTSALCVRSTAKTDLVVDLAEQFSSAAAFTPTGGRVIDSRTGLGGLGRLPAGLAVPLPALGADFVNVTVVNPAGPGYVSVIPCHLHFHFTSTVNFDGATTANLASVVQPDMCVTSSVDTDLVIDRIGSMQTTTEGLAHGSLAGRLLDTRNPPSNEPAAASRLQAGVVQRHRERPGRVRLDRERAVELVGERDEVLIRPLGDRPEQSRQPHVRILADGTDSAPGDPDRCSKSVVAATNSPQRSGSGRPECPGRHRMRPDALHPPPVDPRHPSPPSM